MTLAVPDEVLTVPEVPADQSLTHRHQTDLAFRLGRIGAAALAAPAKVERPSLALVRPGAGDGPLFPDGAHTRKVDPSGRIKLILGSSLAETLGWAPGGLDAVMVDGWLIITQPREVIATPRDRCGPAARFTITSNGRERVTLRPAQLDCLRIGQHRDVLIAPVRSANALVVVNPAVCLAVAPGNVLSLIDPPTDD